MSRMLDALRRIESITNHGDLPIVQPISHGGMDFSSRTDEPESERELESGELASGVEDCLTTDEWVVGENAPCDREVIYEDAIFGDGDSDAMPVESAFSTVTAEPVVGEYELPKTEVVSFPQGVEEFGLEEDLADELSRTNYRYFRDLADNILSEREPNHTLVIMFAAIDSDQGSQSIVVPLSEVLAERADGDVAVVDFNLDRPGLVCRLAVQPEFGLTDVLSGKVNCAEALCETDTAGLFVLSDVNALNVAQLRCGDLKMEPVLDELRRDYSVVILSAASPSTPEVAHVAPLCDGVYLIIRLGITPRRAALRAIRDIQRSGGRVLGCVLTDV